MASFPYQGAGPYVVHFTATIDGHQLAQSTVQVGTAPMIATSAIIGRFYASNDRCTFDTPAATPPLVVARFPTINFAGRPFTDYSSAAGQPNTVAESGATVIGTGRLNHFNAAFTGNLVVHQPGGMPLTFLIDDAFNFGVGGGATRVSGTMSNPPTNGLTTLERLPGVGAFNQGHL